MRVYTVHLDELTPGSLSFGDLIDVSEATGQEPEALEAIIRGTAKDPPPGTRLKILCAFAWVLARHDEPTLTYADVLAGQVNVAGTADPTPPVETPDAPG
jgi:hypothetical protein